MERIDEETFINAFLIFISPFNSETKEKRIMANMITMQNVQIMLYQQKTIMDMFGNAPLNQIKNLMS